MDCVSIANSLLITERQSLHQSIDKVSETKPVYNILIIVFSG